MFYDEIIEDGLYVLSTEWLSRRVEGDWQTVILLRMSKNDDEPVGYAFDSCLIV